MQKISFVTLLAIVLASCSSPFVRLEKFKDFPEQIDGCSCYFSETKAEFNQGVYLYVDNSDDLAFIKVEGKIVSLKFLTTNKITDKRFKVEYGNENYRIELVGKKISSLDETTKYSGMLTVFDSDGSQVYRHAVFGECGC